MAQQILSRCFVFWALVAIAAYAPAQGERPDLPQALGNPPLMMDRLQVFDTPEEWQLGDLDEVSVIEHHGAPHLQLSSERQRYPIRGNYLTEEYATSFPFTEILPSWNVVGKEGTGVAIHVRTRDLESQRWSPWLYLGQWGRSIHWPSRTLHFSDESGATGAVNVDYLILGRPADAFQARVTFYSFDLEHGARPALRRLAISYSGQAPSEEAFEAYRAALAPTPEAAEWVRDLPVPFRSQVVEADAIKGSICSPTSVSMVLAYCGIERTVQQTALDVFDPEYGIFGNWPRNTALAGQLGLDATIQRFRSWDDVKRQIAAGNPVIASIRFEEGEFPSNVMDSTDGHLIVVRGMTAEGDAIVNDSASRTRGNGVIYKADELARAWFDKGGVGYVIQRPSAVPMPMN